MLVKNKHWAVPVGSGRQGPKTPVNWTFILATITCGWLQWSQAMSLFWQCDPWSCPCAVLVSASCIAQDCNTGDRESPYHISSRQYNIESNCLAEGKKEVGAKSGCRNSRPIIPWWGPESDRILWCLTDKWLWVKYLDLFGPRWKLVKKTTILRYSPSSFWTTHWTTDLGQIWGWGAF